SGTGSIGLDAGREVFVQSVSTGGQGGIGIVSRTADVHVIRSLHTAAGPINVVAGQSVSLDGTAVVRSVSGDVALTATYQDFVQHAGSLIDSGFGRVRIHAGFDAQIGVVRSSNLSRFRITATAGNHLNDGGNSHRNVLDAQLNSRLDQLNQASLSRLSILAGFPSPLESLKKRNEAVVSIDSAPITEAKIDANGAIVLSGAD
ncbi:hypothetical protein NS365_22595, partial [Aureimonas ureilytica]